MQLNDPQPENAGSYQVRLNTYNSGLSELRGLRGRGELGELGERKTLAIAPNCHELSELEIAGVGERRIWFARAPHRLATRLHVL